MKIFTIRGAITIEKNTPKDIIDGTMELIQNIEKSNNLDPNNVICMLFSATKDLNSAYPAKAARLLGYINCGLMCFQEMDVENSLEKCIRIIVFYQTNHEKLNFKHIYLKNAKKLRPDLLECK